MSKEMTMSVVEIVDSPFCIASSSGKKVGARLAAALRKGQEVVLSFRNVKHLSTAFLHAAIGELFGRFDEKQIRSLLSLSDVDKDDLIVLGGVIRNAKQYFKDPKKYNRALKSAMEE